MKPRHVRGKLTIQLDTRFRLHSQSVPTIKIEQGCSTYRHAISTVLAEPGDKSVKTQPGLSHISYQTDQPEAAPLQVLVSSVNSSCIVVSIDMIDTSDIPAFPISIDR